MDQLIKIKGQNFIYKDVDEAVQGFISRYYEMLLVHPKIKLDLDEHAEGINQIETAYHKWLDKKGLSDDENKGLLRCNLNFLTGIDDKIKKRNEMKLQKQELVDKIKNKTLSRLV